jgi:hypothetical protein
MFLENDKITADGLAAALTLVETKGETAMRGLTTETLIAISKTRTLSEMYADMVNSIENFEIGVDTMSGMDFTGEALDKMKEFINSGEYGNEQLHSYLKGFFTGDITKDEKTIKEYYEKLKSYYKNEGTNFWKTVSVDGGLNNYEKDDKGNVIYDKNGKPKVAEGEQTLTISQDFSKVNLKEGMTTDELLKDIETQYNMTEEAAQFFLSALTSHSLGLSN